jgi:exonuclease V gamma subunit
LVDLRIDIGLGDDAELERAGIAGVRYATLAGRLAVRAGVLLEVGFQRISARAQLGVWIRHLALCAAGRGDRTVLLARPAVAYGRRKGEEGPTTFELGPVEPVLARSELTRLVRGFLQGQVAPLCFSPEASLSYASKFDFAQAMKQLEKEPGQFFEVFRDEDPVAGLFSDRARAFEEWSRDIFAPMLAHLEEARG